MRWSLPLSFRIIIGHAARRTMRCPPLWRPSYSWNSIMGYTYLLFPRTHTQVLAWDARDHTDGTVQQHCRPRV